MAKKNIYKEYTFRSEARGLYVNLTEPTKATDESPLKYNAVFGLAADDAKELFKLEAELLKEWTGSFTGPDDYQLCATSGIKAAEKAIANAERRARRASEEDAFKIKETAQARADLYREFAGILSVSGRTAFHDRFIDRSDLSTAEQEISAKFGWRLSVNGRPPLVLDTSLKFMDNREKFYRGAFYAATVKLSPYDAKKDGDKDGVTAYLGNVMFLRDGERLAGGQRAIEDEFGHFKGTETDYSPSAAAAVDEHAF